MCVVSMVIDNYRDRQWPDYTRTTSDTRFVMTDHSLATKADIRDLKRHLIELKELIVAAKKYDDATGQPECEVDEKVDFMFEVADRLGISMDDVLERRDAMSTHDGGT